MTKAYLTSLPRDFIRRQAGFMKEGEYFLKRASVQPPESMTQRLWPEIDGWLERFTRRALTEATWDQGGVDDDDLAAQGVLDLLLWLRVSFLQDAAVLHQMFPANPLFQHELFKHADWEPFRLAVLAAEAKAEQPFAVKLQEAFPEYTEGVTNMFRSMNTTVEEGFAAVNAIMGRVLTIQQDFALGGILLKPVVTPAAKSWSELAAIAPPAPDMSYPSSAVAFSAPVLSASATPASDPNASFPAGVTASSPTSLPALRMNRHIGKVTDLWREWTEGYGGKESVESAEARRGLCMEATENKWRSRRKVIITEIKRRATDGGRSCREIAEELEQERVTQSWSLDKLGKVILEHGKRRQ